MEAGVHRFVRVLRLFGLRVSVSEALDAMRAAAQPGVLGGRETLREALRLTLVKDRRDDELFDDLFAAFFSLRPVGKEPDGHGHSHEHDDLADTGELESYTVSDEPSKTPSRATATASRPTSATSSTSRTWPSSTTCTRRPTSWTWPR